MLDRNDDDDDEATPPCDICGEPSCLVLEADTTHQRMFNNDDAPIPFHRWIGSAKRSQKRKHSFENERSSLSLRTCDAFHRHFHVMAFVDWRRLTKRRVTEGPTL